MEREPASSKLFADICLEKGYISEKEYKVYEGIYRKLVWTPDIKLFVDTDTNTCLKRIEKRGRKYEKEIGTHFLILPKYAVFKKSNFELLARR